MKPSVSGARKKLIAAAKRLRRDVDSISFAEPVTHVYNPLKYAWKAHELYLSRINDDGVRVLLLGMNPGPWGMAQTGVPFGEVSAVRDWIGIDVPVKTPANMHPKRPVLGFESKRSEVSGRRLWGLFQERYTHPDKFFADNFIANYCPLVFMEQSARNRTPDKLPAAERELLDAACQRHLARVFEVLRPQIVVGVGAYAEKCLERTMDKTGYEAQLARILHPSPASPAANRDWAGTATKQFKEAGIW
ncbi:MAG TPA: single-stranded DNA-binding protein [Rhodopirellula sp.]|nr:single-stranded DNA-binding protein [Rhodopirellula sp.]